MASVFSSSLLSLTLLLLIAGAAEGKDFLVGGSTTAWKIPSSTSESLNRWAEATRFQVGDSLVWKYAAKKDAVLQVSREAYLSCNTSGPISEHSDGNTVVKLDRPGPYYFISGAKGACEQGEKLIVVVMAMRRHRFIGTSPSPAPATEPVHYDGPAVAPASGASNLMALNGVFVGALVSLGVLGIVI